MNSTDAAYREGSWSPAAAPAVPPDRSGTPLGTIRRGNSISLLYVLGWPWHLPFAHAVTEISGGLKARD